MLLNNTTNFNNTINNNRSLILTINPSNSLARAQRNLTKTVVMASVSFVFCWSWSEWHYTFYATGMSLDFTGAFYNFAVVMASVHCCINPFIYIVNYDQTDREGHYRVERLPPGTYTMHAWFPNTREVTASVTVRAGETARRDFSLSALPAEQIRPNQPEAPPAP